MKPQLKSSRAARELIKTHEPFRPEAVRRGRKWVVGFGHTATAKEGVTVSREDAELLLIYDVLNAEQAVDSAVAERLATPVRDALVSFSCSIGPGAFKVSDVARLAKAGRMREAANALETWVRAEEDGRLVVSQVLTRRRAAEKALFLAGMAQDAEPSSDTPQEPAGAPAPQTSEAPRPHSAPAVSPAPEAEAQSEPQAPAEVRRDVPAGDGDTRPRLGPLVDLEIEFEDPPADFFAAEPEALSGEQSDTALERALGPDPGAEQAEETIQTAEPALERALGEAEHPKTEPASAAAEPAEAGIEPDLTGAESAEAAAQTVAEAAPQAAVDKAEQDGVVQRVMARMARDIADSMDAPARESASEAPIQLGYSFLEPMNGEIRFETSETSPAEAALERALGPEEDIKTEPESEAAEAVRPDSQAESKGAPEVAESRQPQPVYSSVSVGPVPVRGGPVEQTPPASHREAPAPAPGYSGEVGGVGRPLDIEEVEEIEDEELSPELVAGREARDLFSEEAQPGIQEPAGGRWIYGLNFAIGAGLASFGAWDLVSHFELYQREGFLVTGPFSLALGIVLMIAAVWMLATRRKSAAHDEDSASGDDEPGLTGEA